jgi:4'-phosphopantetheinyl transferase
MTRAPATSGSPGPSGSEPVAITSYWVPGPHHPVLDSGAVHVWRASLRTDSDELLSALSRDERLRAARFPRERDGLRWARGRGLLRGLLARYLRIEPAAVHLGVGANGKPMLVYEQRASQISFNMSHSGELALYAFSRAGAVGVDLQVARKRRLNEPALARRALGGAEGRRLSRLDGEQRRREFLRGWTRHEAWLKSRGAGIWERQTAGPGRADRGPWITELEPGAGAAGALAIETRPLTVLLFDCNA